jgi:CheY-like chemotaxis protein
MLNQLHPRDWNSKRYPAGMETPRILIADDQQPVLEALNLLLKNEGFLPETVNSPAAVIEAVRERKFDVLLLDLN